MDAAHAAANPALSPTPRILASSQGGVTPLAGARLLAAHAWPHPRGGWRMALRVQRTDPSQPVELRAFLQHGAQALTETWTALIPKE